MSRSKQKEVSPWAGKLLVAPRGAARALGAKRVPQGDVRAAGTFSASISSGYEGLNVCRGHLDLCPLLYVCYT